MYAVEWEQGQGRRLRLFDDLDDAWSLFCSLCERGAWPYGWEM